MWKEIRCEKLNNYPEVVFWPDKSRIAEYVSRPLDKDVNALVVGDAGSNPASGYSLIMHLDFNNITVSLKQYNTTKMTIYWALSRLHGEDVSPSFTLASMLAKLAKKYYVWMLSVKGNPMRKIK